MSHLIPKLLIASVLGTGVLAHNAWAACPTNTIPVKFAWEDSKGVGAKWKYGDSSNTYTINYTKPGGGTDSLQVTVSLRDPHNINVDPDVRAPGKHHYDPAGACKPSTGETVDDWPGNGSFDDPWDSDCNGDTQKLSTGTGKAYGYPYFTWVLLSSDHAHEAYLDFTFSKPVMMDSFVVGDIDSAGLKWTYNNFVAKESPGNSYQDEVALTATHDGRAVPIILFNQGSGLLVNGNVARSRYDTNKNLNVDPNDPAGTVYARSTVPFNTFTLMYSNGEDDASDEQANPQFYSWWSNTKGKTNGASDNHAIRVSGFDFCIDPDPYSIGNRVWLDTNNNGMADVGEPHAGSGITMELRDGEGNLIQTTTTDMNGRYLFSKLLAGTYQVCVAEQNFAAGGKLFQHRSSTGQTDTETNQTDGVDRGDDDIAGGVCSTVMLLNNQEPTKEYGFTNQQDGDDGQGTPDAQSNLTLDFGFVPPADVELSKVVDKASIKSGEEVTYTLTVINKSAVVATGVKVADQLPAKATLLSATASQGTFAGNEWDVGNLPANGSATLTLKVKVE